MKNELFSSKTMLTAGVSGATVASPAFAAMDLEPGFDAVSEDEALLLAEGACGEGNGGEEGSCGEGACGEGTCGG